jgi:hypothetical protein
MGMAGEALGRGEADAARGAGRGQQPLGASAWSLSSRQLAARTRSCGLGCSALSRALARASRRRRSRSTGRSARRTSPYRGWAVLTSAPASPGRTMTRRASSSEISSDSPAMARATSAGSGSPAATISRPARSASPTPANRAATRSRTPPLSGGCPSSTQTQSRRTRAERCRAAWTSSRSSNGFPCARRTKAALASKSAGASSTVSSSSPASSSLSPASSIRSQCPSRQSLSIRAGSGTDRAVATTVAPALARCSSTRAEPLSSKSTSSTTRSSRAPAAARDHPRRYLSRCHFGCCHFGCRHFGRCPSGRCTRPAPARRRIR